VDQVTASKNDSAAWGAPFPGKQLSREETGSVLGTYPDLRQ
jgi:hypothetical protein